MSAFTKMPTQCYRECWHLFVGICGSHTDRCGHLCMVYNSERPLSLSLNSLNSPSEWTRTYHLTGRKREACQASK